MQRYRVPLMPDDYAKGGETPLVTVVMFTDYACPPCGKTWEVMNNLLEDYGDDLRVVYRAYTVPGFGRGEQAAEAAFSAGAQGKFWEMHARLFEHQGAFEIVFVSAPEPLRRRRADSKRVGARSREWTESGVSSTRARGDGTVSSGGARRTASSREPHGWSDTRYVRELEPTCLERESSAAERVDAAARHAPVDR